MTRSAFVAVLSDARNYRPLRDYDRTGKHPAQLERDKHARLVAAQEVVR